MSASDVAIVERFRAALNRGDEQDVLSLLATDVEFVRPGQTLRGIDEVRSGYLRADAPRSELENLESEFDPGELEDLGKGRVGATNHQVFRWKESGDVAYERRARIEYTIRDGRIIRFTATMLENS